MRLTRRRWKYIASYIYVCILFGLVQTALHLAFLREQPENRPSRIVIKELIDAIKSNLTGKNDDKDMMKNIHDMNILLKESEVHNIPENQGKDYQMKTDTRKVIPIPLKTFNISTNNGIKKIQKNGRDVPAQQLGPNIQNKGKIVKRVNIVRKNNAAEAQKRKLALAKQAAERLKKYKPKTNITHCGPLSYANPVRPVTALASFQGSGNTWLRHLIQEATGKNEYT